MQHQIGSVAQRTIARPVCCSGVGLHNGEVTTLRLVPAPAGHGIVFRRTDIADLRSRVAARWDQVCDTRLATSIGNAHGVVVGTIEHLMAALAGCEIDNVLVEIDGPEVPIMDGSARPFVRLLESAGTVRQGRPRLAFRVSKPVRVGDDDRFVRIEPADVFSIECRISFAVAAIGSQNLSLSFRRGVFNALVSEARTFTLLEQIEALKKTGRALGGSLENAVVVDGGRIVNPEGLRYRDEFVRHKLLDCFGDLYLVGGPITGHVTACKSGHELNNALLHVLMTDPSAGEWVPVQDSSEEWRQAAVLAAG